MSRPARRSRAPENPERVVPTNRSLTTNTRASAMRGTHSTTTRASAEPLPGGRPAVLSSMLPRPTARAQPASTARALPANVTREIFPVSAAVPRNRVLPRSTTRVQLAVAGRVQLSVSTRAQLAATAQALPMTTARVIPNRRRMKNDAALPVQGVRATRPLSVRQNSTVSISPVSSNSPPDTPRQDLSAGRSSQSVIFCPICFLKITKDSSLNVVATECGHLFCNICVEAAFAKRKHCAICQQNIRRELFRTVYL